MKTKEAFHKLIDRIEDEKILIGYFNLIQKLNNNQTGELWNSLSPDEKNELLLSYEESFDSRNLLNHEEVKRQHDKWLGR